MKKKLRKIVVGGQEFLYATGDRYNVEDKTSTFIVKVFLSGQKHTPLFIEFHTIDDYYLGQPLNSGVSLENRNKQSAETVNLHKPRYIEQLILLGLKHGWTGKNTIAMQNGLEYLEELGYNTDSLKPAQK